MVEEEKSIHFAIELINTVIHILVHCFNILSTPDKVNWYNL